MKSRFGSLKSFKGQASVQYMLLIAAIAVILVTATVLYKRTNNPVANMIKTAAQQQTNFVTTYDQVAGSTANANLVGSPDPSPGNSDGPDTSPVPIPEIDGTGSGGYSSASP